MDLEGVKRKLTEGYERINKMKHSTSRLEMCRTRLKAKEDKAIDEVKTMMSNIAQKLYQLQLSMESTIRNTVNERESQLDAKKKEIHDGYANLVKICVEADKVLRGKNVDLLGRSCQRLFCKFEAANIKLDAAERVDTVGLIGFEFQDCSKQFLSNAYLARLQHFNKYGGIAEVDEFWLDYQNTDDLLDKTNETTYISAVSNHTDRSNTRPATVRRSPDRNTSFSSKHCLETIQEVPEDASPVKMEKSDTKSRSWSGSEVVHIRERDLCTGKCHLHNCCSGISSYPPESRFIPPPPGFSGLKESNLELRNDIQQYAYLQRKLGLAIDPTWGTNQNLQVCDSTVQFTNSCPEGGAFGYMSKSNTNFAGGHPHELLCAAFKPIGSCSASPQNLELNSKVRRDRELNTPVEGFGDDEDFIWDSDDSDLQNSGSYLLHHQAEMNRLHDGSYRKCPEMNLLSMKTEEQQKDAHPELDRNENKQASSSVSGVGLNGEWCEPKTVNTSETNHDHAQERNGYCFEPEKVGSELQDLPVTDIKKEKRDELTSVQQIETELVDRREVKPDLVCAEVAKEQGRETLETEGISCPVMKPDTSPADETKEQEAPSVKTAEVPRPLKTKSKRLDLGHMLVHIGEGLFVVRAKCVEKIRGDFDHPIGVCTNSRGDVIVADTNNHIVKVCNNGRVINKFGADLKMRRPSAVVVNEKDEIFVKDDNCLYHFDSQGQLIQVMGRRMMNAPYGLGMTKEGKLIVVDALYSNGRMHVFQQDGAVDTYSYHPLRNRYEDSKCRFLAVHGGDVLTSDLGRSCLYLTNQKGEMCKTIGRRGNRLGELHEPAGVAVDSVGNWVVADSKNHRVQIFAQNGYFMAKVSFTGESIRRPSGIHLTSDGLLYVINYLDSVIKVFKLGAS